MSNRAKGNKWENEVKKILEAEGYVVERAYARLVWIKGRPISLSHDYFGAFDLCGVKVGFKTLWAQITSLEGVPARRHKVNTFPFDPDFSDCRIYARVEGRPAHFKIYYAKDLYQWTGDTAEVLK